MSNALAQKIKNTRGTPNTNSQTMTNNVYRKSGTTPQISTLPYMQQNNNQNNNDILNRVKSNRMAVSPSNQMNAISNQSMPVGQPNQTMLNNQSNNGNQSINFNSLFDSRRNATIQALQQKAQMQKNALAERAAGIEPRYSQAKTEEDNRGQLASKRLAEIMANRGYSTGNQAQNQLIQNVTTQGNISNLEAQRQGEFDQIAREQANLDASLAGDIAQAQAGLEADKMQGLVENQRYNDNYGLQVAGLTGTYGGQRTLAGQGLDMQNNQFNRQFAEGQRQFDVGQSNWQQQFTQATTQQELDNAFRLAQADIQNQLANRQITNQEAQNALDNLFRDKTFTEQQRQFDVGQSNFQDQFAFQKSQAQIDTDFRQKQADIQNALNSQQITSAEAQRLFDNALAEKQFLEQQRQFNEGMDLNRNQFNFQKSQTRRSSGSGYSGKSAEQIDLELRQKALAAADGDTALANEYYNYYKNGLNNPSATTTQIPASAFGLMSGLNPQFNGIRTGTGSNNNISLNDIPGNNTLKDMQKKGWFK